MEEMVEPDRTIMIVSIVGLVVIWGSFFYHKFVQGGPEVQGDSEANSASGAVIEAGPLQGGQKKNKNKKNR